MLFDNWSGGSVVNIDGEAVQNLIHIHNIDNNLAGDNKNSGGPVVVAHTFRSDRPDIRLSSPCTIKDDNLGVTLTIRRVPLYTTSGRGGDANYLQGGVDICAYNAVLNLRGTGVSQNYWSVQSTAFKNDQFGIVRYEYRGDEDTAAKAAKSLVISSEGNVGIGTSDPAYPLHMLSGAFVTSGGVWTNSSSSANKQNIRPLENPLSLLDKINICRFQYRAGDGDDGREHIGVIAEELPEEVASGDHKGAPTADLIALSLAADQALAGKLKVQEKARKALESHVKAQESKLHALEEIIKAHEAHMKELQAEVRLHNLGM